MTTTIRKFVFIFSVLVLTCLPYECKTSSLDAITEFRCFNGNSVSLDKFCDGIDNCGDGSDEIENGDNNHNGYLISCNHQVTNVNKSCAINNTYICNEDILCIGVSKCQAKCDTHYQCAESNNCASRSSVCDGSSCSGCVEDHEWKNGVGFKCRKRGVVCVLPQQLTWDDVSDCDGGVDRCFDIKHQSVVEDPWDLRFDDSADFNSSRCFKCYDDKTFIPRSAVCDGIIDCPDLSDECICQRNISTVCDGIVHLSYQNTECLTGEFQCEDGKCISRTSICDGVSDCSKSEDEKYSSCRGTKLCSKSTYKDQQCRCDRYYSTCKKQMGVACDNIEQCVPYEDFGSVGWADEGYADDECYATCIDNPQHNYTCGSDHTWGKGTPTGLFQCKGDPVEIFHPETNTTLVLLPLIVTFDIKRWCDGIPDCPDLSDEKDCYQRFSCAAGELVSVPKDVVCNGVEDCDDGEDESEEQCKHERFYCSSLDEKLISIHKDFVCDFHINCDDGSDEVNCSHINDRFYCENRQPMFVSLRQIKNGLPDCSDWTDECPTQGQFNTDSVFSSNKELIANIVLRIWVWIMATLSLVGNLSVIVFEVLDIRKQNFSSSLLANHLLIVNLAVADLLMGIFLFGLAIKSTQLSGSYCSQDLIWRSSVSCIALGVISTVSSESSIFMMALLTSFRLYAVFHPHLSYSKPKKSVVQATIVMAWIFAFILALIPLNSNLQHVFIENAVYPKNPFERSRGSDLQETKSSLINLLTFDSAVNSSDFTVSNWDDIVAVGTKYSNHPEYFDDVQYFGFYSQSACIQKFFVTTSDKAWKYSLFVSVLNFLMFFFVAVSYVAVYVRAKGNKIHRTESNRKQTDKRMSKMQRKILRLILTDFCCWVPITMMAFVQLATGKLPDEAYAFSAIILLPINSALNPILYSDLLDKFTTKVKKNHKDQLKVSTNDTNLTSISKE